MRPGCPQSTPGVRYKARVKRRMLDLSAGYVMDTGKATADQFIPDWKSNQDDEGGIGPVERYVHGQEDGQGVRDLAGDDHHQGAVVALGEDGGARDGQGGGAGEGGQSGGRIGQEECYSKGELQTHYQRAGPAPGGGGGARDDQGEGAGGDGQPGNGGGEPEVPLTMDDTGVNEQIVQKTEPKTSRKPKPMYFLKKRGIIPDGLVQTRLEHFRKIQKTNFDGGMGSANQSLAARQREISTNGEGAITDRKRKLTLMCPESKKRREMSTCDS